MELMLSSKSYIVWSTAKDMLNLVFQSTLAPADYPCSMPVERVGPHISIAIFWIVRQS